MAKPTLSAETAKAMRAQVRAALDEDLGTGDLSTSTIDEHTVATAQVVSRDKFVLAGTPWFDNVFAQLGRRFSVNGRTTVQWKFTDGDTVSAGDTLCELRGSARVLLSGERSALNFLQTLSGTATTTAHYVERTGGKAIVRDTRKTIPSLRLAQKYAVQCGGGENHRAGLYDAILIKENHIATYGSIADATRTLRNRHPDKPLEIEISKIDEIDEINALIKEGINIHCIMFDNFTAADIQTALKRLDARTKIKTEASGGITLDNIADYAATGVTYIAIGALTKHLTAPDLSLTLTYPE